MPEIEYGEPLLEVYLSNLVGDDVAKLNVLVQQAVRPLARYIHTCNIVYIHCIYIYIWLCNIIYNMLRRGVLDFFQVGQLEKGSSAYEFQCVAKPFFLQVHKVIIIF